MERVEQVGAYLGIACFVGLAALSVLYFAQARELKRLRDWAGRAPERAAEMQERVAAQASEAARRVQATPIPRPAQPASAPVASTPPPVPAKPASETGEKPPEEGETPAEAEKPAGAPEVPAKAPTEAAPVPVAATTPGAGVAPAPATAAARGAAQPPVEEETSEFSAANGDSGELPALPPLPSRRTAAGRPAALRATPSPAVTRRPELETDRRRNTPLIVIGTLLVIGGVAFGATQLLGGEDARPPNTPAPAPADTDDQTTPADSGDDGRPSRAERGEITVAVLNGTTRTGLAAQVADTLQRNGFDRGTTGNNSDQQRAASQVFYAEGMRAAAGDVARLLKITDVLPIDVNTQGLAGQDAEVVVVVGADQSQ